MSEGYVPEIFCDEITSPPREHPNDWIVARDGRFFLDESDDHSADDETPSHELLHGKTYGFERLEEFGEATLVIREDGSHSVDREMPEGAEQVYVLHDPDTLSDTVGELVANCDDTVGPGEHDISYFTWHSERWTFDAEAKGFSRGAA